MVSFKVDEYKITQGLGFNRGATRFDTYIECLGGEGESLTVLFADNSTKDSQSFSDTRTKRGTICVSADQFDWYVDLLRNEKPIYAFLDGDNSSRNGLRTHPEENGPPEIPELRSWLAMHPQVRNAMRWDDSFTGDNEFSWTPYDDWPERRKKDLDRAFDLAIRRKSIPLTDPPPNAVSQSDNDTQRTVLELAHASRLYLAHLAHSLAVEIMGWVNWSVTTYPADQLSVLFDGRSLFHWSRDHRHHEIYIFPHGTSVPSPPDISYAFLKNNSIVSDDHFSTIIRLLEWGRSNLQHFSNGYTVQNMEDHWQYRGHAPVSRVIAGTVYAPEAEGKKNYTAGCHGTVGFLSGVLRTVNIPVKNLRVDIHALPFFPSIEKYLSHGDDIYTNFARSKPHIPLEEALVGQSTFDAWYGQNVPETKRARNVGRRNSEIAVKYLPHWLLYLRCDDVNAGRSPGNSRVFVKQTGTALSSAELSEHFSLAELREMKLWERMDEKIRQMGGCEKIRWPQ